MKNFRYKAFRFKRSLLSLLESIITNQQKRCLFVQVPLEVYFEKQSTFTKALDVIGSDFINFQFLNVVNDRTRHLFLYFEKLNHGEK